MILNGVLLYISYNSSDYESFISIALNGEVKESYIRIPDELDRLYERFQKLGIDDSNVEWCIVSDIEAPTWDYDEALCSHGYNLTHSIKLDEDALCDLMTRCFKGQFHVSKSKDDHKQGTSDIKIMFPYGNSSRIRSEPVIREEELLKKAQAILESDGAEKTTLAKIIEEKYKRIGR